MPSATTPPSQIPTTHPDIPPFPSPSTFSILPDVYLLIARLNILASQAAPGSAHTQGQTQTQTQTQSQTLAPSSTTTAAAASQSQAPPSQTTPTPSVPTTQPLQPPPLPQPSTQTTTTTPSLSAGRPIHPSGPSIDAKELPAHIYPIKQKLVKARAAVATLPDLGRTVDEQEAEIRALVREVGLLRGRLDLLGVIAGRSGSGSAAVESAEGRGGHDADMQGVEG